MIIQVLNFRLCRSLTDVLKEDTKKPDNTEPLIRTTKKPAPTRVKSSSRRTKKTTTRRTTISPTTRTTTTTTIASTSRRTKKTTTFGPMKTNNLDRSSIVQDQQVWSVTASQSKPSDIKPKKATLYEDPPVWN